MTEVERTLVTGATRFLGQHVRATLRQAGNTVRGLIRPA